MTTRLTIHTPGPTYPWYCRALVHAATIIEHNGNRYHAQTIDAQPTPTGTHVTIDAELPPELASLTAGNLDHHTIRQPDATP